MTSSTSASTSASAKNSASVLLVRPASEASSGVEVFVHVRANSMEFAPGAVVFPGGGVDPSDADGTSAWELPAPLAASLTDDAAEASGISAAERGRPVAPQTLVAAAVRETFEECGVLLARPTEESTSPGLHPEREAQRRALEEHRIGIDQAITALAAVPHLESIVCVDRWITPASLPKRYDTRFFAAVLPEGQIADGHTSESVDSFWIRPEEALRRYKEGTLMVMAPTWAQLIRLAQAETVEDALKPAATGVTMPRIIKEPGAKPGAKTRIAFWGEEAYLAAGKPIYS
ncbi:NUDIX hydrolase [Pseudoglutamicibacter albus]|uniref:NUDIX hydrolase n=1 Tax=Pseudoglutamicibacter albus TaxID=98671 RepID=UPI001EF41C47|nr:NUDIX hydrolase [Pseudoglutamicibacter albus]MCG7305309.1 NUDIX hydrolase [Pseudoglutamicibacter albus]